MAEKLVVHLVNADNKTFKDVSQEVGDVSELSAVELATKLAEFAKKRNVQVSSVVAEAAAS